MARAWLAAAVLVMLTATVTAQVAGPWIWTLLVVLLLSGPVIWLILQARRR